METHGRKGGGDGITSIKSERSRSQPQFFCMSYVQPPYTRSEAQKKKGIPHPMRESFMSLSPITQPLHTVRKNLTSIKTRNSSKRSNIHWFKTSPSLHGQGQIRSDTRVLDEESGGNGTECDGGKGAADGAGGAGECNWASGFGKTTTWC